MLSDTLVELFLGLLKRHPLTALKAVRSLGQGRAHFKQQISAHSGLAVEYLPYHRQLLVYLRQQQAAGRQLCLVTASTHQFAQQVASSLGIFTDVIGSDDTTNYTGQTKARVLTERFGEGGFTYIGNSWQDLPVWQVAASAMVVSNNRALVAAVKQATTLERQFSTPPIQWRHVAHGLRTRQWLKNILLFVPLIAAHRVTEVERLADATIGFVAFSLAASSVYVTNDLLDIEADRQHPLKRHRPFAAGTIAPLWGIVAAPLLLAGSVVLSFWLPPRFLGLLGLYLVLTLLYSFWLKRVVLVDILLLSILYAIRIFAGAAAIVVPVSSWLTAFALFFFLGLACVKRFVELARLPANTPAAGRGYVKRDHELIAQLGLISGLLSVVILALYISSPEIHALYQSPLLLWLIIPLLVFWISRIWFLAHRGEIDEDPTTFALKDTVSYVVGGAVLITVLIATVILW